MLTVRTVRQMRRAAARMRARGTVGFVPTMGYLHEGHLELVRHARARCDSSVVSIFVNPIQFGPGEDLDRYPRDIARDLRLLRAVGAGCAFVPRVGEMYPPGFATRVDTGELGRRLCGRFRPGHFNGVATVVVRLLNIVRPDVAVFGQKDAQQAVIIRRVVRDLGLDTEVDVQPTVREPDGLAMSSRNIRLSADERRAAPVLYRSLELARDLVSRGEDDPAAIRARMRRLIRAEPLVRLQYLAIVGAGDLRPVRRIAGETLVALAAFLGQTRLIDNVLLRTGRSAAGRLDTGRG